jgi:hypothetical protein
MDEKEKAAYKKGRREGFIEGWLFTMVLFSIVIFGPKLMSLYGTIIKGIWTVLTNGGLN